MAVTSDEFPSGIDRGEKAFNASATTRVPVTDQAHSLLPLLQPVAGQVGTLVDLVTAQSMVEELQAVVLSRILPVPSDPIDPDALMEFKIHNANLLGPFRRHLEASIDNMLSLQPALQTRAIERLVEETRETVNEIQEKMGRSMLGRIVRSDLVAALGAWIPPIGAANALVRYFHGPDVTSPLAYGALAQVDLLG